MKPIDIGFAVQTIRRAHKKSQQQIALVAETPRTTISKIEMGPRRMKPAMVKKLAKGLGVTEHTLISIAESRRAA